MPIIKTKNKGETPDKFKVVVTNGNPVPQGTVAGNIIVANNDGTVKDSGINAEELKKSVANGKQLIAGAISDKGIETASDASFEEMAGNISELSSNGEYVWRRYEVKEKNFRVTNPTIKLYAGGSLSTNFKVTSDIVELDKVDASFFDGFTMQFMTMPYTFVYSNGQLKFKVGTTEYNVTWDPNTQIISSPSQGFNLDHVFTYTGTKTYSARIAGEFIEYVIDKNPDKHPQSGEQDGYWYESDKGNIVAENILEGVDIFGVIGNIKKAEEGEVLFVDYFTTKAETKTFVIPDGYDVSKVGISAVSTNRTTAGTPTISYSFSGQTLSITHSSSYFSSNGKTDYPIVIVYFPFAKAINYYSLSTSGTLANDEKKSFVFAYAGDTPGEIQRSGTTVYYNDGIDGAARCLCSEIVFA